MDTATRLVGSAKSRKNSGPERNRKERSRPLDKPSRLRGIGRNLKSWAGGWRTEKLTEGERAWIKRIREGLDQHQAAHQLGMSRWQYQALEKSKEDAARMKIADFEWCRIMRRRIGSSQEEVAAKLGTTRVWVHRMENGYENCDPLIWFWEQ